MTHDDFARELAAFLATVADRAEAEAIAELFALTGAVTVEDEPADVYQPFVYPH